MTVKRYNQFSEELKRRFGCRVQRISLDTGTTCPNRDGSLGRGGCIFCGGFGSGSHGIRRDLDLAGQLEHGKEIMRRKYRAAAFIAYFQSYTGTYAPIEELRARFEAALSQPEVVGLIVATRPDCLSDEVLALLRDISSRTYLWLELGVQSSHDRSLALLNRGHDHASTVSAITRARGAGLLVCAHLILGLPGESREDMFATAEEMNRLGVNGIKLHLLHVMRGTELERRYREGVVRLMERDEYVATVCDLLERIESQILIHRLTGDGGHDNLVAPLWSLKKFEVLNAIDAELERRGTRQGSALTAGVISIPDQG